MENTKRGKGRPEGAKNRVFGVRVKDLTNHLAKNYKDDAVIPMPRKLIDMLQAAGKVEFIEISEQKTQDSPIVQVHTFE